MNKQAEKVGILLMNPQNGEILAMVNVPEFNLNEPFTLNTDGEEADMSDEKIWSVWPAFGSTRSSATPSNSMPLASVVVNMVPFTPFKCWRWMRIPCGVE
mgnify:CR=1 FL=1